MIYSNYVLIFHIDHLSIPILIGKVEAHKVAHCCVFVSVPYKGVNLFSQPMCCFSVKILVSAFNKLAELKTKTVRFILF